MTSDERSRLDVIESKVDTILLKLSYMENQGSDHEIRMRSIERWKFSIPASLVAIIVTVIVTAFRT